MYTFYKMEIQLSVWLPAELEGALYCRSSGRFSNIDLHAVLLVHLISESVVLLEGTPQNHASFKLLEEKLKRNKLQYISLFAQFLAGSLGQCFSTAGPRPGTGPWYQLYRAARGLRKLQYATRFH
jgi:hypothetical protein